MDKLEQISILLEAAIRAACPIRSGNLVSTIQRMQDNQGHFIKVGDEDIDYAAATNEPWVSARWNGKKNPNEGWVENAIKTCTSEIESICNGALTVEEYNQLLTEYEQKYDKRQEVRLKEIEATIKE